MVVWVWEAEERLEEEGAGGFGFEGGVGGVGCVFAEALFGGFGRVVLIWGSFVSCCCFCFGLSCFVFLRIMLIRGERLRHRMLHILTEGVMRRRRHGTLKSWSSGDMRLNASQIACVVCDQYEHIEKRGPEYLTLHTSASMVLNATARSTIATNTPGLEAVKQKIII